MGTADRANDWLSRAQAARYAAVSIATIDRARHEGALRWARPRTGVGRARRVVIRRGWIDAWLLLEKTLDQRLEAGEPLACP